MSCTLLLLGMYVADCAVCRSHTHTGGIGGCMFSSFPQSHPTQQTRSLCCCCCHYSLSVCSFVVGFSVVVHTLLYTLGIGRGNLGGFRRGVREGVSRVDSQPLDQPKITLLYLYCVYLSLFCGFGMGSYLLDLGKGREGW